MKRMVSLRVVMCGRVTTAEWNAAADMAAKMATAEGLPDAERRIARVLLLLATAAVMDAEREDSRIAALWEEQP